MPELELSKIGVRIQQRRKQLGYTQEDIAEKMNVSVQMVSNLERGNKAIKIENIVRLSQILGISTDYILLGELNKTELSAVADKLAMLRHEDTLLIEKMIDYCLEMRSK
ncbi:MAG: helix-turn-helix transcriptional regulator [Clostridia bacterium]|nr:helix-turn-helix transcriptional regulator [Clostridia bacterium]